MLPVASCSRNWDKLRPDEPLGLYSIHSKYYLLIVSLYLQTWDDNLANLAQMWANKCIWAHGFVKFGDQYPYPVNFTEEIGI